MYRQSDSGGLSATIGRRTRGLLRFIAWEAVGPRSERIRNLFPKTRVVIMEVIMVELFLGILLGTGRASRCDR
eukprot:7607018-Pyramimonas_sp.AAC.1